MDFFLGFFKLGFVALGLAGFWYRFLLACYLAVAVVASEPQPESGLIYKLASKGGRIKKGEKK